MLNYDGNFYNRNNFHRALGYENHYALSDMKELDKILKDDDNPFELEEQYRWEWLDDTN